MQPGQTYHLSACGGCLQPKQAHTVAHTVCGPPLARLGLPPVEALAERALLLAQARELLVLLAAAPAALLPAAAATVARVPTMAAAAGRSIAGHVAGARTGSLSRAATSAQLLVPLGQLLVLPAADFVRHTRPRAMLLFELALPCLHLPLDRRHGGRGAGRQARPLAPIDGSSLAPTPSEGFDSMPTGRSASSGSEASLKSPRC